MSPSLRSTLARLLLTGVLAAIFGLTFSTYILMPCKANLSNVKAPHIEISSPLGVQRGIVSELTLRGSGLSGNARLVAPFRFDSTKVQPGESNNSTLRLRITVSQETPLGIYPVRLLTDEGLSDAFPLAVDQLRVVRELEGNDTVETAATIQTPIVIEGQLSSKKDQDRFRFWGRKGQRILVEPQFARIGSRFDPAIRLVSDYPTFLETSQQNLGYLADSPIFAVLPKDDEYHLHIYHAIHLIKSGRSDYRLIVGALPASNLIYPLGGRRGETIQVELRGGTLDGPMLVPVTLDPAPVNQSSA